MVENQAGRRSSLLPGCWDSYRRSRKENILARRRIRTRVRQACLAGLLTLLLTGTGVFSPYFLSGDGGVPLSVWLGENGWLGSPVITAQAAENDYIRVGLKSDYERVGQVTIQNTSLKYGYCIQDVFYSEETLYSGNGFVIRPETGSWSVCKGSYRTYSSAVQEAAKYRTLYGAFGAYPASTGKGSWKVYVPSGTGGMSGKLSGTARNSSHMLMVTTQNGGFLIDAELAGSYPQFAPTADKGASASTPSVSVLRLSGGNSYRGRLEVGRYGNSGVTAVNVLPLEQYLYGVVPSEVPYTWPAEALKAQAVCARGYALLTAGPGSSGQLSKGYRMGNTTLHQGYKGYGVEQPATTQAVDATRGKLVCYENQVVRTYYFSTSGGSTEAVEDVWNSNLPYLQGVSDLFESNPAKKPWIVTMTKQQILSRIGARGNGIGSITAVAPEIRTESGRVYALKIEGTAGSVTLEKDQIRSALGLYSTKFDVISYGETPDRVSMLGADGRTERRIRESYVLSGTGEKKRMDTTMEQYVVLSKDNRTSFAAEGPSSPDSYVFAGSGYGHGVGLSQSGARGMAEEGYTYQEILEHYFTGTTVR